MLIDETYLLTENNYNNFETKKTQIILANTNAYGTNHINGWLKRYNGKYKKTAHFTITRNGDIYKHFDPKYYSDFIENDTIKQKSIIILLENIGWVIKDNEKNSYITWINDIYNKPSEIVEKRWRNYNYWVKYSDKQFNSTVDLVNTLCDEFDIVKTVIGHNTKVDNIINYDGILYRSNIDKHYTDLNPTWDFTDFKNKIENE
jgi:hypothetical protein